MKKIKHLLAGAGLVLAVFHGTAGQADEQSNETGETLRFAEIDWCPQICPGQADKGYIRDIVEAVFAPTKYRLQFLEFPWSRAIHMTRRGQTIGLLSPAKEEAPGLYYPEVPVGYQQMCFFARRDTNWVYSGTSSLKNQRVGVALNTAIPGLEDYIGRNRNSFEFQPYSDTYIGSSMKMVKANRVDSFIFTRNTTLYEMRNAGQIDNFRVAGCVERSPIYVGFTPENAHRQHVTELALLFDRRFQELETQGVIRSIMDRYLIDFE